MAELSYSYVSRLIKADFETGKLFWLPRPPEMFSSQGWADYWNARYAGAEAFTAKEKHGYHVGNFHGRLYKAHRVIWLLHSGEWPREQIDHINGIRSDNRISNLRPVSKLENAKNMRVSKRNTSGVPGVVWMKHQNKWCASIFCNGTKHHLGVFSVFDEAVAARRGAEVRLGFGPMHGR